MSSNVKALEAVAVIALLLDDDDEGKENLPKCSQLIGPWMWRRKTDDAFHTIFQELKLEDAEDLRGYIKLDTKIFWKIGGSSNTVFTEERYKYERVHKTWRSVLRRS